MQFRETAFEPLTNSGFLNATPTDKRDQLLAKFAQVVGEIQDFLDSSRDHHRAELTERKNELYGRGRQLEDHLVKIRQHQGDLRSQLRTFEMESVTPARAELATAKGRKPNSRFPTPDERAELTKAVDAAILRVVDLEAQTLQQRNALRTQEMEEAAVAHELTALIQEVTEIEDELRKV